MTDFEEIRNSTYWKDNLYAKVKIYENMDSCQVIVRVKNTKNEEVYIATTRFMGFVDMYIMMDFIDWVLAKAEEKENEKERNMINSNTIHANNKASEERPESSKSFGEALRDAVLSKTFGIKNVIFSDPATIVFWSDGSKTVVKAQNEDFDPEKGLAMAFARKALGNKHSYYDTIRKYTKKYKGRKE